MARSHAPRSQRDARRTDAVPASRACRNLESDTPYLPELRPFVGHRVEIVVRDSGPSQELDAGRLALLSTLREISQRCQQPNWDGEGAEPISTETYDVARRLLESLPCGNPLPSITAEPDGQL